MFGNNHTQKWITRYSIGRVRKKQIILFPGQVNLPATCPSDKCHKSLVLIQCLVIIKYFTSKFNPIPLAKNALK